MRHCRCFRVIRLPILALFLLLIFTASAQESLPSPTRKPILGISCEAGFPWKNFDEFNGRFVHSGFLPLSTSPGFGDLQGAALTYISAPYGWVLEVRGSTTTLTASERNPATDTARTTEFFSFAQKFGIGKAIISEEFWNWYAVGQIGPAFTRLQASRLLERTPTFGQVLDDTVGAGRQVEFFRVELQWGIATEFDLNLDRTLGLNDQALGFFIGLRGALGGALAGPWNSGGEKLADDIDEYSSIQWQAGLVVGFYPYFLTGAPADGEE